MIKRWHKLSALEMFVNLGQLGISLWVIAIGCFLIAKSGTAPATNTNQATNN